ITRIIQRGQGEIDWSLARKRIAGVLGKTISLRPTFRIRIVPSLFHAFIAWTFMFYLLVNLADILEGMIAGFSFSEAISPLGGPFRLIADVLSVAALFGMLVLLLRRFVLQSDELKTRHEILMNPKTRIGIRRDSTIVGAFIIIHIGSRFLGQSFIVAREGIDIWQPFASAAAGLWRDLSETALTAGIHITFWLALGTILAFIPYFLYSKHIHLFFAPLNFLLKPKHHSIGELKALDFEDENNDQFGVTRLEDLGWEQLMDSYACIMCYRCQQVCPAYNTGKVLSPAAMEINKRYHLNQDGKQIANGEGSAQTLLEFAIPAEAVWACTTCGACIDICPVGNEPMRDILDIRRSLVLMDNDFPEAFQTAFRGMERNFNPWNVPPTERMNWAEGLFVPTIEINPNPEILWWVGCAPATDARAQKTARAFASILNSVGVNYAVLGEAEMCTGDSARRAGNEYLFYELASDNIETLNRVAPPRIVTTCPHCMHTLKNEYPAYGGDYQVIHHSELINELMTSGRLKPKTNGKVKITLHDPCYLGRHNGIFDAPREIIYNEGAFILEMSRHGQNSFCCGAGGAQMWKEEDGEGRVSGDRFNEAQKTCAEILAVGCPFCMIMLDDARKGANSDMEVLDVAEVIAQQLEN
ncbi:MAG: (Fe-S)-binding protein, partial [Chloroflexota bacterium]|nr:(Fe-S)-binding protein [Chloroflexota bacterium]